MYIKEQWYTLIQSSIIPSIKLGTNLIDMYVKILKKMELMEDNYACLRSSENEGLLVT